MMPQTPWSDWFDPQDWTLIESIDHDYLDAHELYRKIEKILHPIFTAHRASNVGSLEPFVRQNFADWLIKNQTLKKWSEHYSNVAMQERPSLKLLLYRACDQYFNSVGEHRWGDPFELAVEKAFQKILDQDDSVNRVAFLLHLEGLFPEEIALMMNVHIEEVLFVIDTIKYSFKNEWRAS